MVDIVAEHTIKEKQDKWNEPLLLQAYIQAFKTADIKQWSNVSQKYEEISGFSVNAESIRLRIKHLKQKYSNVLRNNSTYGKKPKEIPAAWEEAFSEGLDLSISSMYEFPMQKGVATAETTNQTDTTIEQQLNTHNAPDFNFPISIQKIESVAQKLQPALQAPRTEMPSDIPHLPVMSHRPDMQPVLAPPPQQHRMDLPMAHHRADMAPMGHPGVMTQVEMEDTRPWGAAANYPGFMQKTQNNRPPIAGKVMPPPPALPRSDMPASVHPTLVQAATSIDTHAQHDPRPWSAAIHYPSFYEELVSYNQHDTNINHYNNVPPENTTNNKTKKKKRRGEDGGKKERKKRRVPQFVQMSWIRHFILGGGIHPDAAKDSETRKALKRAVKKYELEGPHLYYICDGRRRRVIETEEGKTFVLRECHDDLGHINARKTCERVIDKYYWYGIHKDVKSWVVDKCQICKEGGPRRFGLDIAKKQVYRAIKTDGPWQVLSLVILGPYTQTAQEYVYLMTVTDLNSKFVYTQPLKQAVASEIATAIVDMYCLFGPPRKLIFSNGDVMEKDLNQEIFQLTGINKATTSQRFTRAESANQKTKDAIEAYLGKHINESQTDWDQYYRSAAYCLNTSVHPVTNIMPFEAMFTRKPRAPAALNALGDDQADYTEVASSKDVVHDALAAMADARQKIADALKSTQGTRRFLKKKKKKMVKKVKKPKPAANKEKTNKQPEEPTAEASAEAEEEEDSPAKKRKLDPVYQTLDTASVLDLQCFTVTESESMPTAVSTTMGGATFSQAPIISEASSMPVLDMREQFDPIINQIPSIDTGPNTQQTSTPNTPHTTEEPTSINTPISIIPSILPTLTSITTLTPATPDPALQASLKAPPSGESVLMTEGLKVLQSHASALIESKPVIGGKQWPLPDQLTVIEPVDETPANNGEIDQSQNGATNTQQSPSKRGVARDWNEPLLLQAYRDSFQCERIKKWADVAVKYEQLTGVAIQGEHIRLRIKFIRDKYLKRVLFNKTSGKEPKVIPETWERTFASEVDLSQSPMLKSSKNKGDDGESGDFRDLEIEDDALNEALSTMLETHKKLAETLQSCQDTKRSPKKKKKPRSLSESSLDENGEVKKRKPTVARDWNEPMLLRAYHQVFHEEKTKRWFDVATKYELYTGSSMESEHIRLRVKCVKKKYVERLQFNKKCALTDKKLKEIPETWENAFASELGISLFV